MKEFQAAFPEDVAGIDRLGPRDWAREFLVFDAQDHGFALVKPDGILSQLEVLSSAEICIGDYWKASRFARLLCSGCAFLKFTS